MMKGLELSRQYYEACGKAVFHSQFGSLMERVAVGLVGPGSECLGFDDEHSRDHDWGPGFCLWLTKEDFKRYGQPLQEFYDALPKSFHGFPPRTETPGEAQRVGVMNIESFYLLYTGLTRPPETLHEWERIPEVNLSICTNGKVFEDPLGQFTQWRENLCRFYPYEVMVKKIADCCMHAGQAGQYNWQRGLLRRDPYSVNIAKTTFCTQIIRLTYLINKRYPPFYKWLYKGFKTLPMLAPDLMPMMEELLTAPNVFSYEKAQDEWGKQQDLIYEICSLTIQQLSVMGMVKDTRPFLIDHVPHLLSQTP